MIIANSLPSLSDIVAGGAIFSNEMPVWFGKFGDDVWPIVPPQSPLFCGPTTSSIVWSDYINGRGTAFGHPGSLQKSKYILNLSREIIDDLKVAAVIHGYFPKLLKYSRRSKAEVDPKTVKGRIEELVKFFSLVVQKGRQELGINIVRLDQVPLQLVKELIPTYLGRSSHLKRALSLIADPAVQRNLRAPLQWTLLDITKSSIAWTEPPAYSGIPTLSDAQFLFLLTYCKQALVDFKHAAGLVIHDAECRALQARGILLPSEDTKKALSGYVTDRGSIEDQVRFEKTFGLKLAEVGPLVREAHSSALMLILLFTGMRSSETKFLLHDCLKFKNGYWFLDSKVVKGRPKDIPIAEGWLAIDITRDAYDVLAWTVERTGNPYLFSSVISGKDKFDTGYRAGALNTKFGRWIARIDTQGLFVDWNFSIHQCRETLVFQLAKQDVGLTFISMQLKHFHRQFNSMPNAVTAGYGKYRTQLMTSISGRMADARENALLDVYGENAKFAGGGGQAHKVRIDTFFAGLGLFGVHRERYIKSMARRGVKLMPTSIGSCTKNFLDVSDNRPPPCYGDYQCDPKCKSHVMTEQNATALAARRAHALFEASREPTSEFKAIWLGLAQELNGHIESLDGRSKND